MQLEQLPVNISDGFTLSASQVYLPLSFRIHALAQMECLRLSKGYRSRWLQIPNSGTFAYPQPAGPAIAIPPFSQYETQVSTAPGSYIWGIAAYFEANADFFEYPVTFQVTDACTGVRLFADYVRIEHANNLGAASATSTVTHTPFIINPLLVSDPGCLNVEIYNPRSVQQYVQIVLFCAEPKFSKQEIKAAIQRGD